MFFLAGVLWVALGSIPLIRAIRRRERDGSRARFIRATTILGVDIVVLVLVNVAFGFVTEYWWYQAVGFVDRFWTEYSARILLFAGGAIIGGTAFGFGLRSLVDQKHVIARRVVATIASLFGVVVLGTIANSLWESLLLVVNRAKSGTVDPIFGLDTTFYLFVLPFVQSLRSSVLSAVMSYVVGLGLTIAAVRAIEAGSSGAGQRAPGIQGAGVLVAIARDQRLRRQVVGAASVLFLMFALGSLLRLPGLMYSRAGAVTGVGWLEAHVLVPAFIVSTVVWLAVAVITFSAIFDERPLARLLAMRTVERRPLAEPSAADESTPASFEVRFTSRSWIAPVVVVAGLAVLTSIVPGLIRALVLNPNEITLEAPYIPNHVGFTRDAYDINKNVSVTEYSAGQDITPQILSQNSATVDNIRLWDSRALQDNLRQQQEIRLYYEFHDVGVDRYTINGVQRQMMLSVRELAKDRLDAASQTWVSRHFKYTHGYGLVALPVHEFLSQGRPDLVVRNIPPESSAPRFNVTRPEIYYGEMTNDHVYVKTSQQEFDYPSGNDNVYSDYKGAGGVAIGGFFRRIAFAWRFDGYRQLFSGYINRDSRIMFRRNIVDRVRTIAPFLRFDRDPYPVLTTDGRIVYMIDAYTTSRAYPYSEPYSGSLGTFRGVNYIRNSVKVVVNAYDGSMQFYVVTPDDPIIATYEHIFPDLFKPMSAMPDDLKRHIRYPADLLTIQAETYAVYHMTDPQVFYQREDVWQFATERYRASFQSIEPYYVMLQYPGESNAEFILMLPFTPANKNVMNAWMAGRSDYAHYGEITVYTLPKGVEVLGPRQIEARIDQNTEMSQSLSLWGQRGSEVIRGNMLAIPLFGGNGLSILYVEPIYLQAEDAQLPEIKRIALADQNRVVWDADFDTAVKRLLGDLPATEGGPAPAAGTTGGATGAASSSGTPPSPSPISSDTLTNARRAFADYQSGVQAGDYAAAGQALNRLRDLLANGAGGGSSNE